MSAEPSSSATEDLESLASGEDAAEHGSSAFKESLAAAERSIIEAVKTAERVIKEGLEALRAQTKAYAGTGGLTVDDAQKFVVERVKERPVTAAFAGLGVGLLIGLLLSSRK
jgi:ElaB/YqjD/DUF883 family membrane-anchored ribosome-binding protein